ncbi:hypothetical protein J4434_06790 [Candidatus Woesearchaeota archaeon]|nr:hypothetical protein [Candidatus Woesearchaeota archaeon]
MDKKEYELLKAKFLKLVASVPLPLRGEIIAVVNNQTISWNAAYGEIKTNSDNAEVILNKLKKIGLL